MRLKEKENLLSILDDMLNKVEYYGKNYLKENIGYICLILDKIKILSDNKINSDNIDIKKFKNLNIEDEHSVLNLINCIEEFKSKLKEYDGMKLEVVFLPYKVSMWDSFESVYKAAKNDSRCNCKVVPIPYYELGENRKPMKLCYEGNMFPEDIDIIPYELYNIEEVKPDIIYIHNPYDELNKLTCIDPRYFSNKLCNYTDMLVYIPYYIDGSYINSMEHLAFSSTPGPINATKIIAQSETHRRLFIENGFSEFKVLNLGTPKFDKVLEVCKNEYNIDSEWEEKLKDKKVFLLNLTIDDILNNFNWVDELIKLIKQFENDNTIGLILRSHPLIEVTLKTMVPKYYDVYKTIISNVKILENVIIDNNPDTFMAIKRSNALISGYSSILFQYLATEKPILSFMRNDKIDENREYCVDYLGVYFKDKEVSIEKFIDMVKKDIDYKKEIRINKFKNSTTNINGSCGEKIHDYIKREVLN